MKSAGQYQQNIVIVDTGCANLASVRFAIEHLGYQVTVSDDIDIISKADKVILPGVGSAAHAMKNINAKGLVGTLQQLKQPVLGFCLGMQLMTESSTEGVSLSLENTALLPSANSLSTVSCLGVIPVTIVPLSVGSLRLPHMGWNTLTTVSDHPILKDINVGDYFYFVHSYAAPVSEYTLASCEYGQPFSAIIAKNNFIGCQFHPERSSKLGSKIINNFLNL